MKVFFNLLIVQTILNIYVFFKGWCIIPTRYTRLRSFYIAAFVFEILIYSVAFIWNNSFNFYGYKILLNLCIFWAFLILYMALILLGIDLVRILFRFIVRIFGKKISKHTTISFKRTSFSLTFITALVIMASGYYVFLNPTVKEIDITINKQVNTSIPNPLKIVMFSDPHLGYINGGKELKSYVDLIMEQEPDIVLVGGDIIDYSLKPILENNIIDQIKRLKAPLGVYTCLGNHDHYSDGEEKIKWLKGESGMTILQDSIALVDSTLYIVGREEFKSPRKKLNNLMDGLNHNYPIFVLNHQPNNLQEEISANVDLALYGHTHDGQIYPFTQILRNWYDLSAGYTQINNTHIFVTSGLGGIPQLRIDSKSEIIVVNCNFTETNKVS